MSDTFRIHLAPPVFPEDEDKTRSASILNTLGWSTIVILVTLLVIRTIHGQNLNLAEVNSSLIAITISTGLILYISRRGYVKFASLLFVSVIWLGLSCLTWLADGIRAVAFFGYFIPILMAGLLLGWRGAAGFIFMSILSDWILAYAQEIRIFSPTLDQPLSFARDMTGIYILTGILIYLIINNLQEALNRTRSTTHELSVSNRALTELHVELERHVEQRTAELRERATQLEAVSRVAQAIASVQDINVLLPDITQLVGQQFGFYHVAIFLVDESGEFAVLRASNSDGGQRMLGRSHRLPLDTKSIVGYTASTGEPRVTLDVGTDSIYFYNPDLPATRSEMALPLRVGGRAIGVLDVQSVETDAFSKEDIAVLDTLAAQIAIAIENARLLSEVKHALAESKVMLERYTKQDWINFAHQARHTGFVFDGKKVLPLDAQAKPERVETVFQTSSLPLKGTRATIAVPIKLRGQTIGVLDVRSRKGGREWTQDEIAMMEAAAEHAALALENARLVENAERRASRERAIGEISTKIGAVTHLESILQTAVEELGRQIGGASEVTIELETEDNKSEKIS